MEAEASAFISLCNSPKHVADPTDPLILTGDTNAKTGSNPPSTSNEVVAEVVVEAGVLACHVCSSLAKRSTKPDDTDSFTPRVRSDKRSITILLGKVGGLLHNRQTL